MFGWFGRKKGCPHKNRLANVGSGQQVFITELCCKERKKLYSLGLIPGRELKVLINNGSGAILIQIDGSNISLCRGLSKHILVHPL